MIGPVSVRVSAANPDIPLREVPVFRGSACSIGVEGVPAHFGGVAVTGVAVAVETPLGAVFATPARRSGCMWVATFPAGAFVAPGTVRNGVTVKAFGMAEDGTTPAEWTIGKGDLAVIDADGVPVPGETWQNVHLRDAVPSEPVKGDLAKVGADWKIYDGTAWQTIGGGAVVESATNPGYAANADSAQTVQWSGVGGRPDSFVPSAHAATHALDGSDPITPENIGALPDYGGTVGNSSAAGNLILEATYDVAPSLILNPAFSAAGSISVLDSGIYQATGEGPRASIKKGDKEVATEDELLVRLDLVGDGSAANPYAVRLDGETQTYAQVKALAETRNAVIRHGRGTYRVTYVGAAEMMWDCTGTVQGEVQTGMIHMFAEGNVVQLVPAKALATASQVYAVSATAAYPIAETTGALADRTVNHAAAGGAFTFPARTGANARDFVLVLDSMSTAPTVIFPSGVTYVSDQDAADVWTAEANKVNAWYFSEVKAGVFMVSHKSMAAVAQ